MSFIWNPQQAFKNKSYQCTVVLYIVNNVLLFKDLNPELFSKKINSLRYDLYFIVLIFYASQSYYKNY